MQELLCCSYLSHRDTRGFIIALLSLSLLLPPLYAHFTFDLMLLFAWVSRPLFNYCIALPLCLFCLQRALSISVFGKDRHTHFPKGDQWPWHFKNHHQLPFIQLLGSTFFATWWQQYGKSTVQFIVWYDVLYIDIMEMWFKHPCIIFTLLSLGVVEPTQADCGWENEYILLQGWRRDEQSFTVTCMGRLE